VTKADGTYYHSLNCSTDDNRFLLASLYLTFLERQRNKSHIRSALDDLSTDLNKTYAAAISRIHTEPERRNIEIALKALLWITFAREPLQTKALLHALAISEDNKDIKESDLEDIQTVVSLCVGLASVDRNGVEIRLVHETTKEYLQKYFQDKGKENADGAIAQDCLRYFLLPAFSRVIQNERSLEEHLDKYKLSSYASRYCFLHIREGNLEEKFAADILKTFERQDIRDLVFQIAEYPYRFDNYHPAAIQLLHLASMRGLAVLCREILGKIGKVQGL